MFHKSLININILSFPFDLGTVGTVTVKIALGRVIPEFPPFPA